MSPSETSAKDSQMITFEVQDMTCGHCVGSITRAIQLLDPGAQVQIDLTTHRVRIAPTRADASQLGDAIQRAGYTPVAVGGEAPAPDAPPPRRACCCR